MSKLNLEKLKESLAEHFPNEKFLISMHVIEDGKIRHSHVAQDFPNGDLFPCINYLEDEFVKILKRGATGNGRM